MHVHTCIHAHAHTHTEAHVCTHIGGPMHGICAKDRRQDIFQESVLSFYFIETESKDGTVLSMGLVARLLKEGFISKAGNGPCLPPGTGL